MKINIIKSESFMKTVWVIVHKHDPTIVMFVRFPSGSEHFMLPIWEHKEIAKKYVNELGDENAILMKWCWIEIIQACIHNDIYGCILDRLSLKDDFINILSLDYLKEIYLREVLV